MYENKNKFEQALFDFATRIDIICAMEISKKIDAETAYQNIKDELKELKRVRKSYKKVKDL
jgi:hypothetical protein